MIVYRILFFYFILFYMNFRKKSRIKEQLARPPTRSSLKITNRSFQYAAPCLWNELPTDLREPRQTQFPSLSPIIHGNLSSSSSRSSRSPLASSLITRSVFHSKLKTWLFGKSFPPYLFLSYRTDFTDHLMFLFCSTAGYVCMLC